MFAALAVFLAFVELIVCVVCINILNNRDSDRLLELIGRESAGIIDRKLEETEHCVNNVYYYAYDQLEELYGKLYGSAFRSEYLKKVEGLALNEAGNDRSIICVYYRLSTDIKEDPVGFMYKRNALGEMAETENIDISKYERDDIQHVGWYWIPRRSREAAWVGPFYYEELGENALSYVYPVYVYGRFAGIVGMDVSVDRLCSDLSEIKVYDSGYFTVFDKDDNMIYRGGAAVDIRRDAFGQDDEAFIEKVRTSLNTGKPTVYNVTSGSTKLYACKLENGMTLCISAPLDEINATRGVVIRYSVIFSILVMAIAIIAMYYVITNSIKALEDLKKAAERMVSGDLDTPLPQYEDNEIGKVAETFDMMRRTLKKYYDHFHSLAYTDSLTGLNNKASFSITRDVIDAEIQMRRASFSVIVMDVNNLKIINDSLGHQKGDVLLKHISACMRSVFTGYPLYRIGGDEFCAIIIDPDPSVMIDRLQGMIRETIKDDLEGSGISCQVACGAATYSKDGDRDFADVFNRADKEMYENKKTLKEEAHLRGEEA